MQRLIYMDNAATTPVSPGVLEAMLPYFVNDYGNPSSVYSIGRTAKKALETAREAIALALGAQPQEIFFTSGGSEADNWAVKGVARALQKSGKRHVITTAFEHHAVLYACRALENEGFAVTYLPVHADGLVRPEELEQAIRPDTALASVMYANNEIGTIQPIPSLAAVCKKHGVLFHTDAVQAVGNVAIQVEEQGIDLLSLSGHKIHAAKGVGALYIRRGVPIESFLHGGAQERGRRAGTENLAGIVGLSIAMQAACSHIAGRAQKTAALRDRLINGVLASIPRARLNGSLAHRLPGNCSFCFEGVEGESLLLMLDMQGVCGSSGSACTSGAQGPSHVLLAIGLPEETARGSLRLTLNEENTQQEVDEVLRLLPPTVARLREMSPLWDQLAQGS